MDEMKLMGFPIGIGIVIGIVVGNVIGGSFAIGVGVTIGMVVGAAIGAVLRASQNAELTRPANQAPMRPCEVHLCRSCVGQMDPFLCTGSGWVGSVRRITRIEPRLGLSGRRSREESASRQ
jgi:hypothetical protein